jgi:outer membrane protein OmpU
MKKLLLTTTALALSAGVAAADVTLSGDGRMGLFYDGDDVSLISRARVTFTLTGETDGGVAFGGSFRADQATAAASGTLGKVFIDGAFGRLEFGDVAGGARAATGDLHPVGLTAIRDLNEMVYVDRLVNGIDGTAKLLIGAASAPLVYNYDTGLKTRPRALYTYSIDGLSLYASVAFSKSDKLTATGIGLTATATQIENALSLPAGTIPAGTYSAGTGLSLSLPITTEVTEVAVGAKYEFDGFMVAAGVEQARFKVSGPLAVALGIDGTTKLGHGTLALGYTMDNVSVKAIYGAAMNDLKGAFASNSQYGISATGTFDAVTVSAYARRDFAKTQFVGLGAAYDLGGGAALRGGVTNINPNSGSSTTLADFGVAFTF